MFGHFFESNEFVCHNYPTVGHDEERTPTGLLHFSPLLLRDSEYITRDNTADTLVGSVLSQHWHLPTTNTPHWCGRCRTLISGSTSLKKAVCFGSLSQRDHRRKRPSLYRRILFTICVLISIITTAADVEWKAPVLQKRISSPVFAMPTDSVVAQSDDEAISLIGGGTGPTGARTHTSLSEEVHNKRTQTDFRISFTIGLGAPTLLSGGGVVDACVLNVSVSSCVGGIAAFAAYGRAIMANTSVRKQPLLCSMEDSSQRSSSWAGRRSFLGRSSRGRTKKEVTFTSQGHRPKRMGKNIKRMGFDHREKYPFFALDEENTATLRINNTINGHDQQRRETTNNNTNSNTTSTGGDDDSRGIVTAYQDMVDLATLVLMPELDVSTPFVQMHPGGLAVNLDVYSRAGIDTFFAYPSFYTQSGNFDAFYASTNVLPVASNLQPPTSSRWRSVVRSFAIETASRGATGEGEGEGEAEDLLDGVDGMSSYEAAAYCGDIVDSEKFSVRSGQRLSRRNSGSSSNNKDNERAASMRSCGLSRIRVGITRSLQTNQAWSEPSGPALIAILQNMRTTAQVLVVVCGDIGLPVAQLLPFLGENVPDVIIDRSTEVTNTTMEKYYTPRGKLVFTGSIGLKSTGVFFQMIIKKTVQGISCVNYTSSSDEEGSGDGEEDNHSTTTQPPASSEEVNQTASRAMLSAASATGPRRAAMRPQWEEFAPPTPDTMYAVETVKVLLGEEPNAINLLPDAYKDDTYWELQEYLYEQAALAAQNDPALTNTSVAVPPSRVDFVFPCFAGECAQGTLYAKSYWWRYGADIGMTNSGGPRGPGWPAGPVRTSNVWYLMPFHNYPCIGTILGLKVWELVNASMAYCTFSTAYGTTADRFMQTFGLEIEYDNSSASLVAGTRVRAIRVLDRATGRYEPLERLKYYSFVTDTYQCTDMPIISGILQRLYTGESLTIAHGDELVQTTIQSFLKTTSPLYSPTIVGYLRNKPIVGDIDWPAIFPTTAAPTPLDSSAEPSASPRERQEIATTTANSSLSPSLSTTSPPRPTEVEVGNALTMEDSIEYIKSRFMLWGETAASCTEKQRWDQGLGSCIDCPRLQQQDSTNPSRCIPIAILRPSSGNSMWIYIAVPLLSIFFLGACILVFLLVRRLGQGVRNTRFAPKGSSAAILFTDIQMSTKLWGTVPASMAVALDQHHAIVRGVIKDYKAYEVKTVGDSFMIAVSSSQRAVELAMQIQLRLMVASWPKCINLVYAAEGLGHVLEDCIDDDPNALSDEGIEIKWRRAREGLERKSKQQQQQSRITSSNTHTDEAGAHVLEAAGSGAAEGGVDADGALLLPHNNNNNTNNVPSRAPSQNINRGINDNSASPSTMPYDPRLPFSPPETVLRPNPLSAEGSFFLGRSFETPSARATSLAVATDQNPNEPLSPFGTAIGDDTTSGAAPRAYAVVDSHQKDGKAQRRTAEEPPLAELVVSPPPSVFMASRTTSLSEEPKPSAAPSSAVPFGFSDRRGGGGGGGGGAHIEVGGNQMAATLAPSKSSHEVVLPATLSNSALRHPMTMLVALSPTTVIAGSLGLGSPNAQEERGEGGATTVMEGVTGEGTSMNKVEKSKNSNSNKVDNNDNNYSTAAPNNFAGAGGYGLSSTSLLSASEDFGVGESFAGAVGSSLGVRTDGKGILRTASVYGPAATASASAAAARPSSTLSTPLKHLVIVGGSSVKERNTKQRAMRSSNNSNITTMTRSKASGTPFDEKETDSQMSVSSAAQRQPPCSLKLPQGLTTILGKIMSVRITNNTNSSASNSLSGASDNRGIGSNNSISSSSNSKHDDLNREYPTGEDVCLDDNGNGNDVETTTTTDLSAVRSSASSILFDGPPPPAVNRHFNGLRVRIGIHYGPVDAVFDNVAKGYDYYGNSVNIAARIEAAADGGQIVVSRDVANELTLSPALSRPSSFCLSATRDEAAAGDTMLMKNGSCLRRLFKRLVGSKSTNTGSTFRIWCSTNTAVGHSSPPLYTQKLLGAVQLKGVVGLTELLEITPVALEGRVFTSKAVENVRKLEADETMIETLSRAASTAMLSLSEREKDLKDAISRVFQPLPGRAKVRFGEEIAKAWRVHFPSSFSESQRFEKTMHVLAQRIAASVNINGNGNNNTLRGGGAFGIGIGIDAIPQYYLSSGHHQRTSVGGVGGGSNAAPPHLTSDPLFTLTPTVGVSAITPSSTRLLNQHSSSFEPAAAKTSQVTEGGEAGCARPSAAHGQHHQHHQDHYHYRHEDNTTNAKKQTEPERVAAHYDHEDDNNNNANNIKTRHGRRRAGSGTSSSRSHSSSSSLRVGSISSDSRASTALPCSPLPPPPSGEITHEDATDRPLVNSPPHRQQQQHLMGEKGCSSRGAAVAAVEVYLDKPLTDIGGAAAVGRCTRSSDAHNKNKNNSADLPDGNERRDNVQKPWLLMSQFNAAVAAASASASSRHHLSSDKSKDTIDRGMMDTRGKIRSNSAIGQSSSALPLPPSPSPAAAAAAGHLPHCALTSSSDKEGKVVSGRGGEDVDAAFLANVPAPTLVYVKDPTSTEEGTASVINATESPPKTQGNKEDDRGLSFVVEKAAAAKKENEKRTTQPQEKIATGNGAKRVDECIRSSASAKGAEREPPPHHHATPNSVPSNPFVPSRTRLAAQQQQQQHDQPIDITTTNTTPLPTQRKEMTLLIGKAATSDQQTRWSAPDLSLAELANPFRRRERSGGGPPSPHTVNYVRNGRHHAVGDRPESAVNTNNGIITNDKSHTVVNGCSTPPLIRRSTACSYTSGSASSVALITPKLTPKIVPALSQVFVPRIETANMDNTNINTGETPTPWSKSTHGGGGGGGPPQHCCASPSLVSSTIIGMVTPEGSFSPSRLNSHKKGTHTKRDALHSRDFHGDDLPLTRTATARSMSSSAGGETRNSLDHWGRGDSREMSATGAFQTVSSNSVANATITVRPSDSFLPPSLSVSKAAVGKEKRLVTTAQKNS